MKAQQKVVEIQGQGLEPQTSPATGSGAKSESQASSGSRTADSPDQNIWERVQGALDQFYKIIWPMAVALTGVGIATMAIMQMVKAIFPVHEVFNREQINRWIEGRLEIPRVSEARLQSGVTFNKTLALNTLIKLATAGNEQAFYSLDTKHLTGQISAAAQIVLDYPMKYRDLYLCLTAGDEIEDVTKLLESPPPPVQPGAKADKKSKWQEEMTPWIDAKRRISHLIERNIDGLQISMSYRWKRLNQMAAFGLNFAFVLTALLLNTAMTGFPSHTLPVYIVVAILGGFVAPVAKDLVSSLQQLKNRAR